MLFILLVAFTIPLGLDLYMPVPEENPITAENIEVGRRLFRDRRLSRDSTIACLSCHDPERAFSKPERVSTGVFGRLGTRNAPALINRGWGRSFFWDGRAATLEEQVLKPIEDPNEMDLPIAEAAVRVGQTPGEISRALATYLRSIMSGNSRFDRYVNGEADALSAEEQAGLRVFRGNGNCTACHLGPNFSDERFHNTGVAWSNRSGGGFTDDGRRAITGKTEDQGAFKTPTLREVALTAPYMHNGSIRSLDEVVEYYDRGGNRNPLLDRELRPLRLTAGEKAALVAFLGTLSGRISP
jgi:cytochrome c peroxidase